jgi:hypothetical protein
MAPVSLLNQRQNVLDNLSCQLVEISAALAACQASGSSGEASDNSLAGLSDRFWEHRLWA